MGGIKIWLRARKAACKKEGKCVGYYKLQDRAHRPSERIVDAFDKFVVLNLQSPQGWSEPHGKTPEALQIISKLEPWYVIDYVQKRYTSA